MRCIIRALLMKCTLYYDFHALQSTLPETHTHTHTTSTPKRPWPGPIHCPSSFPRFLVQSGVRRTHQHTRHVAFYQTLGLLLIINPVRWLARTYKYSTPIHADHSQRSRLAPEAPDHSPSIHHGYGTILLNLRAAKRL